MDVSSRADADVQTEDRTDEPPLRVLHLALTLSPTSSQYNEHCLPMIGVRDISIVTYFPLQLEPHSEIAVFPGDGSVRGFFRALRSALDAKRYDALHAHSPHLGALVFLALLLWGRLWRLRRSTVYTVHDSFYDYKFRNQALMVVSLATFKSIVFCSHAAYESLPWIWKKMIRGRWRVVQNGADFERVDRALAEATVTRDEAHFTVISVGRLEKVKDPEALIDAFASASGPTDRLVMIGAGQREGAIRERVARLGLESQVSLTGLIPRDEVYHRLAAADLLVSTSHGEGLPLAVLEAMATGCPVVLSDIPPHREVVDDADFIPLVKTGDAEGFAREIRRFREMAPEGRETIGRRCRDHAVSRFSLSAMHAGMEAAYCELSGSSAP